MFICWGVFFMGLSKYTVEQKLKVLQLIEEGNHSIQEIRKIYGVSKQSILHWQVKYETEGIEGLQDSKRWRRYPKELKLAAVQDYLDYGLSLREVLGKYQIRSSSVLKKWVQKYTSHRELKDSGKGMSKSMTKGRKTTFEERIEIVQDCLANERNYQATAEKYRVSYQQVYSWVKKYETHGEEGLQDRRGRTKPEAKLTEEEKLRLRIQQIERENERLRAENLFLKKLEEIERRR